MKKTFKKIGLIASALLLTLSLSSCSKEDFDNFFNNDDSNEVIVPLDDYYDKTEADSIHDELTSSIEANASNITSLENKFQTLDEDQGECFDRIIELEESSEIIDDLNTDVADHESRIDAIETELESKTYLHRLKLTGTGTLNDNTDSYVIFIDYYNDVETAYTSAGTFFYQMATTFGTNIYYPCNGTIIYNLDGDNEFMAHVFEFKCVNTNVQLLFNTHDYTTPSQNLSPSITMYGSNFKIVYDLVYEL